MTTHDNWFIEHFQPTGSAIGFRITGKLDEVQSPFQKIEIYDSTDWGKLMVIDGAMMLTTKDNFFYHEMISHPVLFTHPAPRRVVIIGGGDCGTLREVLKHPGVESATQCDIDEQVTRMAEKYFPELCESNGDARAELLFDDGVAYMANCAPGSVDVVIVDSTDPVGPAEGLFNKAFFERCFRALKDDGLIATQCESFFYHGDIIERITGYAKKHFAVPGYYYTVVPTYPSGIIGYCFASKKYHPVKDFRADRVAAMQGRLKYYNADLHRAAFMLPSFIRDRIKLQGVINP